MTKANKNFTSFLAKYKLHLTIALILLILIEVFITGYTKFIYNVVRCGQVPVAVQYSSLFLGGTQSSFYNSPGKYNISVKNMYYCTELDAQKDGIQKDPLQGF